jgi:NAD-specific glutamate dehydrogenase
MTVMNAIRSAETEEAKSAAERITHARALLPEDRDLTQFFDALYASAVPDDILRNRPDQLAALAVMLDGEATRRVAGANHVAALDWGHETVLLGINDDRPFLFDSALAAALAFTLLSSSTVSTPA